MQRLEVSGAVRPIYGSLGFKRLTVPHSLPHLLTTGIRTIPHPPAVLCRWVPMATCVIPVNDVVLRVLCWIGRKRGCSQLT